MKITVGLVGPQDSISLVQSVGREREDIFRFVPFQYEDVEEVPDLVRAPGEPIDLWLFTGKIAYEMGKDHVHAAAALTIRSNGSALMKTLFRILRDFGLPQRFSIDTLTLVEVKETLDELLLDGAVPVVHPAQGYVSSAELVAFHESLFRSGEVQVCITHRGHVYEELRKRGTPVFRIVPTAMSIRETLRLAVQLGETNRFRQSQIAALLVRVNPMPGHSANAYDSFRLNLKLQELALQFAEHISGTLIPNGNATFHMFSTRGAIERNTSFPPALLFEKFRLLSGGMVHFGIGYGMTAFGAEQNALLALSRTDKHKEGGLAIVDETGAVGESFPAQESISFHYRSDNLNLVRKLKLAGLSTATFNKIVSVQSRLGKESLTAADLTSWLDMSQRNANRLLSVLESNGLASIVGEESPTPKGRPRKLYRIEAAEDDAALP